jgi:uncharacterized protein (DUF1810 family)
VTLRSIRLVFRSASDRKLSVSLCAFSCAASQMMTIRCRLLSRGNDDSETTEERRGEDEDGERGF